MQRRRDTGMYCSSRLCPPCWNLFPPNRVYHLWRLLHKEYPSGDAALPGAPKDAKARREEIARMLAGAEITEEARAAAGRLIEGAG